MLDFLQLPALDLTSDNRTASVALGCGQFERDLKHPGRPADRRELEKALVPTPWLAVANLRPGVLDLMDCKTAIRGLGPGNIGSCL